MFGYRLRSNVADPEEVDIMIKKVYRLLNHILNIDYDIFEPNNKDNWESTLDYFYKYMEAVENEAIVVLDQCIDSLKSAEQGLELIAYMSKTETRDKLLKHLISKRESVMKKFVIEVGIVEHEFLVSEQIAGGKEEKERKEIGENFSPSMCVCDCGWDFRFRFSYLKSEVGVGHDKYPTITCNQEVIIFYNEF